VQRLGGPSFRQLRLRSASVGPGLGSDAEIAKELESWTGLIGYEKPSDIVEATARLLAEGSVVGWAQGRSEFGPRALGKGRLPPVRACGDSGGCGGLFSLARCY
jgi:predicted NodU family carbamoyl transferase